MADIEKLQALLDSFNENLQQIAVLGESYLENKEAIIALHLKNSAITSELRKICSHEDSSPLISFDLSDKEIINEYRRKCNICSLYFHKQREKGDDKE